MNQQESILINDFFKNNEDLNVIFNEQDNDNNIICSRYEIKQKPEINIGFINCGDYNLYLLSKQTGKELNQNHIYFAKRIRSYKHFLSLFNRTLKKYKEEKKWVDFTDHQTRLSIAG